MATYKQIQEFVKREHGILPKTCWIADVKEQAGLPVKRAWNRQTDKRVEPCPKEKIVPILDAFRHYGMID